MLILHLQIFNFQFLNFNFFSFWFIISCIVSWKEWRKEEERVEKEGERREGIPMKFLVNFRSQFLH